MSLISMHGAWLSFSDAPLLDNAELHIEDNERVCLVGRNGAGKSTLMKILNREQGLDDGRIIYEQGSDRRASAAGSAAQRCRYGVRFRRRRDRRTGRLPEGLP